MTTAACPRIDEIKYNSKVVLFSSIFGVRVSYENLKQFSTSTFGFLTFLVAYDHTSQRNLVPDARLKVRKSNVYEEKLLDIIEIRNSENKRFEFV